MQKNTRPLIIVGRQHLENVRNWLYHKKFGNVWAKLWKKKKKTLEHRDGRRAVHPRHFLSIFYSINNTQNIRKAVFLVKQVSFKKKLSYVLARTQYIKIKWYRIPLMYNSLIYMFLNVSVQCYVKYCYTFAYCSVIYLA